jgi:hypothetical protein
VFGVTRETTQFRTEQSVAGTLSEKSALEARGRGGTDSGAQAGRIAAGGTIADSDLLSRAGERYGVESDSGQAAELLARQQRTNMAGAIDGASIDEAIVASREGASRSAAFGEVLADENMARNIGRTEAITAGMHARATDETLDAFGRTGVQAGATNQQMRSAAEGVALTEGGFLSNLNLRLARVAAGERMAHSNVVDMLGNLTGVDTSTVDGIRRLSIATEGARQTIMIDANEESKERIVQAMGWMRSRPVRSWITRAGSAWASH